MVHNMSENIDRMVELTTRKEEVVEEEKEVVEEVEDEGEVEVIDLDLLKKQKHSKPNDQVKLNCRWIENC